MNDDNPQPTSPEPTPPPSSRRPAAVVAPEKEHQKVVTEGQLKWAQFHAKRRASSVRQQVEALWQTPVSVEDVDGAQSDDGNTSVESLSVHANEEDDEATRKLLRQKLQAARQRKPSISKGRRALLKVSQRALQRRREEIQTCGYRCGDEEDQDDNILNTTMDEALAAQFADETAWKKARRNRRKRHKAQERLRRFENAFRAMMMSLAASQPQSPEIATPTKVWSRPEDAPAFVSIDGRQYRDLKWGVAREKAVASSSQMLTTTDFASMPVDPRASWLVHIPSKAPSANHKSLGQEIPTNANGELLIPENTLHEKSLPIPLGSEKFNQIVGTLQSKAELSQQQMQAHLELMAKHRNGAFKWQIGQVPAGYPEDEEDDDMDDDADDEEEEEETLDAEHLKTLAAQYLTEFVANADEEHLIAALGEQYKDDVETLVEAASDQEPTTTLESQDMVRKYLQDMNQPQTEANQQKQEGAHQRNQMASFAGIAARYLAEVSRPRPIEKTVNSCRQEQGRIVQELKSVLDQLYANGTFRDNNNNNKPTLLDSKTQSTLESILAKYTLATGLLVDGSTEMEIVSELRQREGREFTKLLLQYLEEVKHAVIEQKKATSHKRRSSRGSFANRYMESLGKGKPQETQSASGDSELTSTEQASPEQMELEGIALDFLQQCGSEQDVLDEKEVVSLMRGEKQSNVPNVVSKYLKALSDTIVIWKEKDGHGPPSDTQKDHFALTRPVFAELGVPTAQEKAKQRTFEAIAARYLANVANISEDAIFKELAKPERQGFSRLMTIHLDEIMEIERPGRQQSGPATRYIEILLDGQSATIAEENESENRLIQRGVESIVFQYLDQISASSHKESYLAGSEEERTQFSRLVSGYLDALCDSLPPHSDIQDGSVAKYLESLNTTSTNNVQPKRQAMEKAKSAEKKPFVSPSASTGTRRGSLAGQGKVAAKYLSAVVDADDFDDDDIFAELRKQDSPKVVDENKPPSTTHSAAHQSGFGDVQVPTDHNLEAHDAMSPLSQATGLPQVSNTDTDISFDRKTAIMFLSKLRSDCKEEYIEQAIGHLGNTDQARAQFARGITRLLMGTKESKRSRAAASRYLAAMRGLAVDPEPEALDAFASALIDEAAEMLVECSCEGDPRKLARALRKLGKEDGERFAAFASGYLNGTYLPPSTSVEEDAFNEVPAAAPQHVETPSHNSTAGNSHSESDFFAGMRANDVNANYPTLDPYTETKKLSYGGAESQSVDKNPASPANQGDDASVPNVLKNTFNSLGNRRDSYRSEVEEEKKTSHSASGSSSFDHADVESPRGNAENIPFDPTPTGQPRDAPSTYNPNVHSPSRSYGSPNRSHASNSQFSPDRLKDFHQSVMEKSALIGEGNAEQTIIDTDGDNYSEASGEALSPRRLAGLLLSPTILTKRHRQAVQAIENRKWDQVSYLLNANPWLAEMPEIRTNQYLLHKIAFFGAGTSRQPPAPQELCTEIVKMYAAVQKFDKKGCLPLHNASEAGNLRMIALLGDRWATGASVRNDDGMLPIHLAIASHSKRHNGRSSLLEVVKSLLGFFKGALAVTDNNGNLPLHIAAKYLDGDEGIDVINFLLDEADKQLQSPEGIRFRNKPKVEDTESVSATTATAATSEINSDADDLDDQLPPSLVENDAGDIPLWIALAKSSSGIIESLAVGPGGKQSALKQDKKGNTALHRALLQDQVQTTAVRSILKVAPETALEQNGERMLPIEMACLKGLSPDIVLELLLADLPISLSPGAKPSEGESLWFLVCECRDRYLSVLETLISMCSYQQVHEIAFMTHDEDSRSTLISCASPECGEFLTVSLLFVGRFEFLQYDAQDVTNEIKVFDALDYGSAESPYEEGRRVSLRCFTSEELYKKEISSLRNLDLDFDYVAQVSCFVVGERDSYDSGSRQQFCVAVEQPSLTLDRVVAGMLKNDACKENSGLRRKYVLKIFSVLRIVAKALYRLHSFGVIHGNLVTEACGKCGDRWKLLGTLGFQKMGAKFDANVFGESVPPEALEPQNSAVAIDRQAAFRTNLGVDPAVDVWGFGKLSYDVLVGEPLVDFDRGIPLHHDHNSLLKILHWSTLDLVDVRRRLRQVGVPDPAVYLITKCLSPDPSARPSMDEVLQSGPWEDTSSGAQRPAPIITEAPSDLHEC